MVTDKQIKLIIGSLLHDIGKVVYRSGDGRNHSQSGYDYLKDEADIKDIDILNCVRYHHGVYLRKAKIPQNSNAYITYFADNIAAFADRRENENPEDGFDKTIPLDSVFNILNGNNGKSHYAMQVLDVKKEINYPTEKSVRMEDYFYQTIIRNITDNLMQEHLERDSNKKILLSVALPRDEELECALNGASYQLSKRSGFVASSDYADEWRKKKELFVFVSGSCFEQLFEGDVYDVSDGGSHPVYRYAKSLFMGV